MTEPAPASVCLPCAVHHSDDVIVRHYGGFNGARVLLETHHAEKTAQVVLDAEHARTLFNWLGVWLHTRAEDGPCPRH